MRYRLVLDGPLGDRVVYTGLPEAHYRRTGQRLRVASFTRAGEVFLDLYDRIPYAEVVRGFGPEPGERWHVPHMPWQYPDDFWVRHYRPSMTYHELTGVWLEREQVNPNLYLPHTPVARRCVVSDEAGWVSRRGYPYFDKLVQGLRADGWEVVLMRNLANCPRQVSEADHHACFDNHNDAIRLMQTAALFVGYESGLANVAGALGVPYVLLCGATLGSSSRHRSCFHAFDACAAPCGVYSCLNACLHHAPDVTDAIRRAVKERFPDHVP